MLSRNLREFSDCASQSPNPRAAKGSKCQPPSADPLHQSTAQDAHVTPRMDHDAATQAAAYLLGDSDTTEPVEHHTPENTEPG